MKPELFRIDSFLLRTGFGLLILVGVLTMAFKPWEGRDPRPTKGAYIMEIIDERGRVIHHRDYVWSGFKTEEERLENLQSRYPNAVHIAPMEPKLIELTRGEKYFLAAGIAPLAMLATGMFVRRREKRMLSIWKMLRHNLESHVGDLVANTGYTREQIEETVRLLNKRGLGFYAWRRDTDVIEDGRLNNAYLHIERCDSCGASVGLKVPASLREVPRCTYCQSAQSADHLNSLKLEVIRDLQTQTTQASADTVAQRPMSIGLFIFLILLCWPAAIAYAVYKSSIARRLA